MPWTKIKKILLGGEKNVRDPRIFHRLSLIAFFAWVGLGADGLSSSNYGPQEAFDGEGETRWATDSGTKQAWIVADLGRPQRVLGVRIDEAIEERVRQFEFQDRDGGAWKTIFVGQKLGSEFQKKIEPVTAQQFRLNILDASEGPTINEIELLTK